MRRLLLTLIIASLLALVFSIVSSAAGYGLYDKDDELSTLQEEKIENQLKEAYEQTGASFYIGIGYSTEAIESFVSQNRLYEECMVVLLIEKEYGTYYYQMHTRGNASYEITLGEENKLLDSDEVYDNIKSGDLYNGASYFISKSVNAYTTKNYKPYIIFCIISTLVGTGIFFIVVLVRYKTKIRGKVYPFDQFTTLDLVNQSDIFLTKSVTRTKIQSSSSGGSRGGGGFRSSGRR